MHVVDLRQHVRAQRRSLEGVEALAELRERRRADDHRPVADEPAGPAEPEPDLSAESTPTGGWCQMKQASSFTENLTKLYQN